ncbi:winged helix-turn-helix transcriptional regulator [Lactobacillus rhamnosus]|uniref:Winged helix-turn-helix transcriptional regulator n=1 Tax=Lacticaseibacillus rhamnosus TaxID=47715 RepID=A0A7Y7QH62_LACRH|nr:MarR family transcriptional regulator [Lacticaseibacillus rhamnosus]NVO89087.1 winged helix-turn-helix transcriptional regulator [Lacticaseibacillus rhamnosus]
MTVSLGILVKKLNNDLQRYADREAKQLGLTQVQMSIIDFLARQGTKRPLYQTDVEHEFNIQKSSATALLQLMERKELIVRVPSKQDGRYKAIQLTEKSQKVAAYIRHFFDQNDAFLRNELGGNEEVVVTALKQLQKAMAEKLTTKQ